MLKFLQKLVRNGGATQVTIPRQVLGQMEWIPGQSVIVEVTEQNDVRVRAPKAEDFSPLHRSLNLTGFSGSVK